MADEIFDGVPIRVVRSEDQGMYLIQIGIDGAFRTFTAMKLGKLDSLRQQARDQAAQEQPAETPLTPPPPAQ